MDLSIIHYYGIQSSRCGYCKGKVCSKAHSMHAYTMTPQDYQDLIDRGWRRSGQYCYKPHNSTTCCPSYTIKCDALEFKLSKSHKKILKRMNRFLRDGKIDKNEENSSNQIAKNEANSEISLDVNDEPKAPKNFTLPAVDLNAIKPSESTKKVKSEQQKMQLKKLKPNPNTTNQVDAVDGAISTTFLKQTCDKPKKAKQIRLERRQAKLAAKGLNAETLTKPTTTQNAEKSLADFITATTPDDKHKLKIVLKPSATLKVEAETFDLYRKYQMSIHNDPPDRLTPTRLERFLYKSPLKLQLVHVCSKEFSSTLSTTYALYQKYQTNIHNDPPEGLQDYLTFLGRGPLKHHQPDDGPPQGYGSFHQQYWLDDKLIAVGVIDILPHCLSSVYFFYDPEYSFLSLGTYASLREIEFVQQLSQLVPELKYYYMGFYIHSCPKMRYKGKLVPSYLVCPETYTWHLLTDETRHLLDTNKYQRLNPDPTAKDINEFKETDLNEVLLLLEKNICATYGQYKEITGDDSDDEDHDTIFEYGKFVGKICAHRMVFVKA